LPGLGQFAIQEFIVASALGKSQFLPALKLA